MDTVNVTDTELVYHTRETLLRYSTQVDVDGYNQLVGTLHRNKRLCPPVPDNVALLVTCLKALSGAVSCMDPVHHRLLLAAICEMSLWNYDSTDVMDALVELLVSLVGSSGQYVDLCLDTLVRNFMPPDTFLDQISKNDVVDRVHSALKHIHDLVPLSPLRLEKIIKDRMPNIYTHESLVVIFVENMLRLESSDFGKLVGSTMISMIVDMLVELDVEISWDDILQENSDKGIFEMELEKPEDPEGIALWSKRFFKGDFLSAAQKLDSLMVLFFEHLKSSSKSGRLLQVFEPLLASFQKTVMTAYKPKFAQFVMFYACSLDRDVCGTKFAVTLIDIFESSDYPPELRMSSLAYLASYLSRAKFVSVYLVRDMIERLVKWCRKHDDAHKDFYGACQAIMYVLCFRLKEILAVPRLRSVLGRVNRVFNHPLNPLEVCLPTIVEEFLRVAKQTPLLALPELVTSDGMLESDLSVAFGGRERLDMFFPFDPCLLKRSESYIRPSFLYWSMVDNTLDEDNDDEATSDEEVDDIPTRSDDDMMDRSYEDDEDSDVDVDEF